MATQRFKVVGQLGRIVSMVEFQGRVFVATEDAVYELLGPKWVRMEFAELEKEAA